MRCLSGSYWERGQADDHTDAKRREEMLVFELVVVWASPPQE
jgi:hypothetical protein